MKAMSQDWKAAGSAGHETDEGLWKKFREIQDAFWAGKRIDTENRHAQQVYTWMDENDEKVKTLENDIEDIQKRLDEDN